MLYMLDIELQEDGTTTVEVTHSVRELSSKGCETWPDGIPVIRPIEQVNGKIQITQEVNTPSFDLALDEALEDLMTQVAHHFDSYIHRFKRKESSQ